MGSYLVVPDKGTHDLVFRGIDGGPTPTEDEQVLVTEIERTLRGLRALYEGRDAELDMHFGNLTNLARAGLTGPQAQPAFARRMLIEFRSEILEREGAPRKNRYMSNLGGACLRVGIPAFVIGLVLRGTMGAAAWDNAIVPLGMASNVALLIAACCAGVWVSFGARKARFTFEDLSVPEDDFLYPSSRIAFACILTGALALLFHSGAAKVSLGAMSTADVLRSPVIALIVGFLCGFSEQVLAKTVAAQAGRILGS